MKTMRRTQMLGFEGASLSDFVDDFNSKMEWVARTAGHYEKPIVELDKLRGYVIYEEMVEIPEGYKDQLRLHHECITCGQCKNFRMMPNGYGDCPHVRFGKGVKGLVKFDPACDKLYSAWEDGDCWLNPGEEEKYAKILDEYRCANLRHEAVRYSG